MAPAKQHILSQENRSDMLAHIAQVLGGCESQQLCLSHHHHAKRGIDPSHRGQRRQRHKGVCEGGLRHNEADVLEVELLNTPGTLAKFDSSSRTKRGMQVLGLIRAAERTRSLPVIILTSSADEQDRITSYGLATVACIRKPLGFRNFLDAVLQCDLHWVLVNEPSRGRRAVTRELLA
jgi:CheY-like chemotaxis protein